MLIWLCNQGIIYIIPWCKQYSEAAKIPFLQILVLNYFRSFFLSICQHKNWFSVKNTRIWNIALHHGHINTKSHEEIMPKYFHGRSSQVIPISSVKLPKTTTLFLQRHDFRTRHQVLTRISCHIHSYSVTCYCVAALAS